MDGPLFVLCMHVQVTGCWKLFAASALDSTITTTYPTRQVKDPQELRDAISSRMELQAGARPHSFLALLALAQTGSQLCVAKEGRLLKAEVNIVDAQLARA